MNCKEGRRGEEGVPPLPPSIPLHPEEGDGREEGGREPGILLPDPGIREGR